MYGLPEDDAVLVTRGSPSGSAWKKSWKIQKAELAEMMTRRSLSWKLSKALERSGASDPRVKVALLNIWPKSAVDQATVAPRAPACLSATVPCSRPFRQFCALFSFFSSLSHLSLGGHWLYILL